eukprot:653904-Pyramimonas_sp.AAC.1
MCIRDRYATKGLEHGVAVDVFHGVVVFDHYMEVGSNLGAIQAASGMAKKCQDNRPTSPSRPCKVPARDKLLQGLSP